MERRQYKKTTVRRVMGSCIGGRADGMTKTGRKKGASGNRVRAGGHGRMEPHTLESSWSDYDLEHGGIPMRNGGRGLGSLDMYWG